MKILYHHRTQAIDGCVIHIEELIAALRRLGHSVEVVAPGGAGTSRFAANSGLVGRLRRTLPRTAVEMLELGYALLVFLRLFHAWWRFRPDVVYERYALFTPASLWLKALTGVPVMLEVNAPLAEERACNGGLALAALARWSERATWRHADLVLPVTRVLSEYVQAAGVPEKRIAIIPNGISRGQFDCPFDRQAAKAALGLQGRMVLGFAGFMRSWHRLDQMVEALAQPELAEAHLLLVGDGPARRQLETQAHDLGISDRLTITGVVSHVEVPRHVAAFDIALQPAATPYASPLKLFEYMAAGCAILAPDLPNIREVLTDGDTALLFVPTDPAASRAALRRLCHDAELREHLGTRARASIAEHGYTWDANAHRVITLAMHLPQRRRPHRTPDPPNMRESSG